MGREIPSVSVVIPTHNRPHVVRRAVESALNQTFPVAEVIVVVDGGDSATLAVLAGVKDTRLVIEPLSVAGGAGAARNFGISRAQGDFVAFLDDDDFWLPEKIELQLRTHLAAPHPARSVSACAAFWDRGPEVVTWPRRPPRSRESISDYLFVRRRAGEGVLATPTLMLPRSLANEVPMPTHLSTHEEWDWLVSLQGRGARPVVEMTPLVKIDARPARASVSSTNQDWVSSLAWAWSRREDLGGRAYSAFVLNEAGRAAALSRAGGVATMRLAVAAMHGRPRVLDILRHLLRPIVFRIQGRIS